MTSVIVVGAGIVGMYSALRLAQLGAHVTLLEAEAEDFGGHGPAASLAAAGMLAPISEAFAEEGAHPNLAELGLASFDLWREQAKGAIWEDGVRFDGAAFVARDAAEAEAVHARAGALGRDAAPITPGQWKKRTGLDGRIDHALFIADEAIADPERVLTGLHMEAHRHGVAVHFRHDVKSVAPGKVEVWDGPDFSADHVVLAPGAWANDALRAAAPPLKTLRPAKGCLAPVMLERELAANVRAPDFYLARRHDNDVVLGATMQFDNFSRTPDMEAVAGLFAAAEKMLPGQVKPREGVRPWAGVRPMSPDWAPLIGRCDTGVLIAAGHSRNGWLLAPVTAEIICAEIFGWKLSPLWQAFRPERATTPLAPD
jgi:glycine oxidase